MKFDNTETKLEIEHLNKIKLDVEQLYKLRLLSGLIALEWVKQKASKNWNTKKDKKKENKKVGNIFKIYLFTI